jgi:peptide deformylase
MGDDIRRGWTRREWILVAGPGTGGALLGAAGCATAAHTAPIFAWTPEERNLWAAAEGAMAIPPAGEDGGVLRRRAREIDPHDPGLGILEARMRATLADSGGVGLAAPQVGLSVRAILVTLGARGEAPETIGCLNPRIVERSDGLQDDAEGCLSVTESCGLVRRNLRVRVAWVEPGGVERELEAEGFDARVFQHEIDHLDGILFTDRIVGVALPKDLLRPLRAELERRRAAGEVGEVIEPDALRAIADVVLAAGRGEPG